MNGNGKVVWTEGMFLRVQNFQQADRHLEQFVNGAVAGLRPAAWGVRELVIQRDLLATGTFSILRCRGTLPDGTPFSIPENDDPPLPLDLPEGTRNCVVYLAVPIRERGGVEFDVEGGPAGAAARYRTSEVEVVDTASNSAGVAHIRIGRLSLRLMLETAERKGYVCLGLARVGEVRADRNATLDDAYIPPCLDAQAAPTLSGYVGEVRGLVHHRAEALAQRVAGGNAGGVAAVADFLMLQLLNRTQPLLAHFGQLAGIHPLTCFETLLGLAGELATFTQANKRPVEMPAYRHDDLQASFLPIIVELRRSLQTVLEQQATPIPLQERKYGIRVGTIADRSLLQSAIFVLAIKADLPTEAIRRNFPSLVKIGPVEQIRELVNVALPGIRVRPLPVAPRQIPYHAGATYFELERANPIWKQLEASGGIAIHLAGDFPGIEMEFWAIRG